MIRDHTISIHRVGAKSIYWYKSITSKILLWLEVLLQNNFYISNNKKLILF
jgi:hypothetical protein